MTFRISVDTGGTFTDVVIADGSGIRAIGKALTTPKRIFDGMRAAIEVVAQEIELDGKTLLSKGDMLIYGTTRATNAVVTKSTAKTAFLTTRARSFGSSQNTSSRRWRCACCGRSPMAIMRRASPA